jgi:hypothetical protein
MGDLNNDYGNALEIDPSGNVICTGAFVDTVDFDPGLGTDWRISNGAEDIFVQKLDSSGNLLWVNTFGSTLNDASTSLTVDGSGNVYLVGDFRGSVDFDPGLGTDLITSAGGRDIFVQKSDALGNEIWTRRLGTAGDEQVTRVRIGPTGALHLVGWFTGTMDFDPTAAQHTLTSVGISDAFVTKWSACNPTDTLLSVVVCNSYTSPSGNHIWINSGNYSDTLPNTAGCDSIITIALTVETAPAQPGTMTGPTTVCAGTTNTYSVTAIPGATSYTWTLPNGWTGNSLSNSMTATAGANSGTIIVVANNTCGSSAAQTLIVTVQPLPFLTGPVTGNAPICEGSTNTYSVTPDPNATSYFWILPGGWSGNSTTNSITTFAGGAGGNVLVMAINGCGSSNTVGLPVNVYPIPSTAFNWTSNQLAVTFNNTSQFAFTYSWDFGDGNTSTLQHPVHTYASPGTYNVCLTASDNNCSATICHVIVVTQVGTLAASNLEVLISPNPSTGEFVLECHEPLNGQLLDAQGRVVAEVVCVAGSNAIDLTAMADGVYLLMLRGESTNQIVKLLKLTQ